MIYQQNMIKFMEFELASLDTARSQMASFVTLHSHLVRRIGSKHDVKPGT